MSDFQLIDLRTSKVGDLFITNSGTLIELILKGPTRDLDGLGIQYTDQLYLFSDAFNRDFLGRFKNSSIDKRSVKGPYTRQVIEITL